MFFFLLSDGVSAINGIVKLINKPPYVRYDAQQSQQHNKQEFIRCFVSLARKVVNPCVPCASNYETSKRIS